MEYFVAETAISLRRYPWKDVSLISLHSPPSSGNMAAADMWYTALYNICQNEMELVLYGEIQNIQGFQLIKLSRVSTWF